MIEMVSLALTLAAQVEHRSSDRETGRASVRIERAARIGAQQFDPRARHARVVEREEDGQVVQLHLIEFE